MKVNIKTPAACPNEKSFEIIKLRVWENQKNCPNSRKISKLSRGEYRKTIAEDEKQRKDTFSPVVVSPTPPPHLAFARQLFQSFPTRTSNPLSLHNKTQRSQFRASAFGCVGGEALGRSGSWPSDEPLGVKCCAFDFVNFLLFS